MNHPRLIIAGLRGGSGKTTVSLGLISSLRSERGLAVAPFKKGPDYIDAGWMSVAAQRPCYNLDPFLIPKQGIVGSFLRHASGDIAIIEGNRGLYDGLDVEGTYSTAELAKLLNAPVIIVIDCTKMTRTTAALVLGCIQYDRGVPIQGVIINQIAGKRHESVIRAAIERSCSVPVVGAIPRFDDGAFPERHMGLTPHHEHPDTGRAISFAEAIAGKYLDLDAILGIAHNAGPVTPPAGIDNPPAPDTAPDPEGGRVRIGVIRDSAFQFYYPENLEELQGQGAEIVEINALKEAEVADVDALYIGGGFPETHALALAENEKFRSSLREAIDEGLPVYAECGGLMYLGAELLLDGRAYPMTGVFPLRFSLEKKPQAHGYSVVEVISGNPFYPVGTVLKGHEFHYSRPVGPVAPGGGVSYAFRVARGQGIEGGMDGLCHRNVLATYTHLHALGAREWVTGMINQAREFRRKKTPSGR